MTIEMIFVAGTRNNVNQHFEEIKQMERFALLVELSLMEPSIRETLFDGIRKTVTNATGFPKDVVTARVLEQLPVQLSGKA